MQITMTSWTQETVTLDVEASDPIISVLSKCIEESPGFPPGQPYAILAGQQLEYRHSLSDYNITQPGPSGIETILDQAMTPHQLFGILDIPLPHGNYQPTFARLINGAPQEPPLEPHIPIEAQEVEATAVLVPVLSTICHEHRADDPAAAEPLV